MTTSFLPVTNTLLALDGSFTVLVEGINEAATSRALKVTVNATQILDYVDGILSSDPAFTFVVTTSTSSLSVKITRVTPPVSGDQDGVDISYQDSLTAIVYDLSAYAYGALTVRAQYPAPEQDNVSQNPPLTLVVEPQAPFTILGGSFLVNGEEALQDDAPKRPDFSGRASVTASLVVIDVFARRYFNKNERVAINAGITVTPDAITNYVAPVTWYFHTTLPVTPLRNPGFARTGVDLPHASAPYEMFRRGLLGALRPATSNAAFAVLLYYGVKSSGYASLRVTLPGARDLELEKLLPQDRVSPMFVYDSISKLEPFWRSMLDDLVRAGAVRPERAELLDRGWKSQNATDAVGAACAAVLYGHATP